MKKTPTEETPRPRGKPFGHRAKPQLYDQIIGLLERDRQSKGDGMTACAVSKSLGVSDPTIRLYLNDLQSQKRVTCRKIAGMVLYRLPKNTIQKV
jgi:hypothetical protein